MILSRQSIARSARSIGGYIETLSKILIIVALFGSIPILTRAAGDSDVVALKQADTNHDGVLSSEEVIAGLRRQLGLRPRTHSRALTAEQARFKSVFGPGPSYRLSDLAANPYFNAKIFGLGEAAAPKEKLDTVHLWVPEDKHVLKVRRTLDDLLEDLDNAKGALISYTNDFNSKTDQWSFHGIVGLNLIEEKNVHFGENENGVRVPLSSADFLNVTERWFIPSVQWDKVTTSGTNADEIDALIFRVSTGFKYVSPHARSSLFDGIRFNFSGSYASDSSLDRGVAAGELDIKPFKSHWDLFNMLHFGVNSEFQRIGFFGIRPELTFHMEGGTVTDDGGDATLMKEDDFLRVGGNFGLSARFEQVTGRFHALRGLLLRAGLQYYVDVTNSGPDVDLFTASADWLLDPPKDENDTNAGHYTLVVEYRNGRSSLVLQRDNRITVGLGVKY